jgi:RHS repeat-associated protein
MLTAAKEEQSVSFLAASWLSQNPHLGHQPLKTELHRVIELAKSLNASGLATSLYDDGRRSRSTGKERDSESGLDYFGARYYGSALGRFTSPDEIFGSWDQHDPQTFNLYGYVRNNPLRYTDPDGHDYHVCVGNGNGGQNCFTLGDDQYQVLFNQQNGQQGISLPGGPSGGNITCGGTNCGSVSYTENSLHDPLPGAVAGAMAGDGAGFALTGAFRGIVSLFIKDAGEEGGVVIGKMTDLKETGALKPGERELDLPNLNDPRANWAQNSSRLREAMSEGKPIRDASAEPFENGNPGKNTGFLRAERNLLENHGWSYRGGSWYPPSK